jgi:hypothetical protein
MGQSSMTVSQRLGWRADELVELVRQRAEGWWPKDLQLTVVGREDGDWTVVTGQRPIVHSLEPELAFSITQVVGAVRSRNAWNGY